MSQPESSDAWAGAAASLRTYFTELQARFLEREDVLFQLQLALLSREHLLLVGPPGTGKSALVECALGGLVDGPGQGRPSLFSRQLTESTVQTDLLGPVDFKVLTETGRTEYLTDEGMLGARFAFLDEIFDGRDMLLRAALNVLHERELKHGHRVTVGQVQTAVLTSNRYLSEVLERSPELLIAFADRVAFAAYVPKTFVHPRSRAAMLEWGLSGPRPQLSARLGISELQQLQAAVDAVEVPAEVAVALELLVDGLERRVLARGASLPGYRPTRIYSQRGLVKAQGVLRAAVIHAAIWREPGRAHVARLEDLAALRASLVLGGARGAALEVLRAQAVDPRERAQLEIVRLEGEAFEEALAEALAAAPRADATEAQALRLESLLESAGTLSGDVEPATLLRLLEGLAGALVPGPRHASNRRLLLRAARSALLGLRQLLRAEFRPGAPPSPGPTRSALGAAVGLVRAVAELAAERSPLAQAGRAWLGQRVELCAAEAEARTLETPGELRALGECAESLAQEVFALESLGLALNGLDGGVAEGPGGQLDALRERLGRALEHCVRAALQTPATEGDVAQRALDLRSIEPSLLAVSASLGGLREALFEPLLRRSALRSFLALHEGGVEVLARWLRGTLDAFAREGLPLGALLFELAPRLRERLEDRALALEALRLDGVPRPGAALFDASRYGEYVNRFSLANADAERAALDELVHLLDEAGAEAEVVTPALRERLMQLELHALEAREGYLAHWFEQLLGALPDPAQVATPAEASEALERLVKSHFPLLALREGELFRLSMGAQRLDLARPDGDARARALHARIAQLQRELERLGQGLLAHPGA